MDNQFDNNIYGFEPQKPLTEKPGTPEPEDIPKESEPAPQPPVQTAEPSEDRDFDPIRHTAVYSGNSFLNPTNVCCRTHTASVKSVCSSGSRSRSLFSRRKSPPAILAPPFHSHIVTSYLPI